MNGTLALVADIGGTNARFALADLQRRAPLLIDSVRLAKVADFSSLADAARHCLDSMQASTEVKAAVFAIAGHIENDEVRVTNHPWVISRTETQRELHLHSLHLINDFAAQAMAIQLLTGDDLVPVGPRPWPTTPAAARTFAVLGPGTGLGVSALLVRDGRNIVLETEGGHVSFAPTSKEETAILERLTARYGRVSNERLISGGGLVNIHQALCEIAGEPTQALQPQDVTAGAASGDARCRHAVEVFFAVFGAVAGDLVLTLGAWDGVLLSGGLVPRLLAQLQQSSFRQRFEAKGRFAAAMAPVPTVAVMHPYAGLLGAAAFALQEAPHSAAKLA